MHAERLAKSGAEQKFLAEAQRTASLQHTNLVTVHDAGYDASSGQCYYSMEYVHGRTLATILGQHGSLQDSSVLSLGRSIASGLAHAHRAGVIHRDLKPENILLDQQSQPKITDLGLAVDRVGSGASNNRRMLTIVGTPGWGAPEQARNPERVTPTSDVFSFGCVAYAMATASEPFDGETVIDLLVNVCTALPPLLEELSPTMRDLIEPCLAIDPNDRPANGDELVSLIDQLSHASQQPSPTTRNRRRPPTSSVTIIL